MIRYTLNRILWLIPVVLVVSIIVFALSHLAPGDPARALLGGEASQAQVDALRERMGLNQPVILQYLTWLGRIAVGDLGESVFLRQPVLEAIATHYQPSLWLGGLGLLVALAISIPLGTLAARLRGSWVDNLTGAFTLVGMAVPSFVLALIFVLVFAVQLRAFPVAGYIDPMKDFSRGMSTLILPAGALGMILAALITRTTRAAVLDVVQADNIVAARARGVGEARLLFAHTLKNAGLPILTVVGVSLGIVITGTAVTETIFNIPGIGSLVVNAVSRRDYPVIQGVVLFVTLAYLAINLLIDLLYALIDPRVRLGKGV